MHEASPVRSVLVLSAEIEQKPEPRRAAPSSSLSIDTRCRRAIANSRRSQLLQGHETCASIDGATGIGGSIASPVAGAGAAAATGRN